MPKTPTRAFLHRQCIKPQSYAHCYTSWNSWIQQWHCPKYHGTAQPQVEQKEFYTAILWCSDWIYHLIKCSDFFRNARNIISGQVAKSDILIPYNRQKIRFIRRLPFHQILHQHRQEFYYLINLRLNQALKKYRNKYFVYCYHSFA